MKQTMFKSMQEYLLCSQVYNATNLFRKMKFSFKYLALKIRATIIKYSLLWRKFFKSFAVTALSSHCDHTVGSWRTMSTCIKSILKKKISIIPCGYNRMWRNWTEIPPLQILSNSPLLEVISLLSVVQQSSHRLSWLGSQPDGFSTVNL